MGQHIDQFREDLHLKLANIDKGFAGLKAKIDEKAKNADQEARSHLEKVHRRIEQNRAKVSAAQAEIKDWAENRKIATADKIADWKSKREINKLRNRADGAEQYAAAAIVVSLAAADEAEQAAVEAWLARQDADAAQTNKA